MFDQITEMLGPDAEALLTHKPVFAKENLTLPSPSLDINK